jgi:hypothetical protein
MRAASSWRIKSGDLLSPYGQHCHSRRFHARRARRATSRIRHHLIANPPDIYLRSDIRNVGLLEFFRVDQLFEPFASIKDELRYRLRRIV